MVDGFGDMPEVTQISQSPLVTVGRYVLAKIILTPPSRSSSDFVLRAPCQMAGAIWAGLMHSSARNLKNGFVGAEAGGKTSWSRFLPTPARFFDREEVRSAVLRRDREVFEGEEPLKL